MCKLRSCVERWADGCDFIRSMTSEKCVIDALPGYSMCMHSEQKHKTEDDSSYCVKKLLSIRLRNIFFMLSARFDRNKT